MEFRNFDPRYTGELLKHMDSQNEVLMEAYRSMFHELRKLQVEEEMLMRKMHEVMSAHGPTKSVDEEESVAPEAVLATREGERNGKTISEAQLVEEATWEASETETETIKEKFPSLCFEENAEIREGDIDGNPVPMVLGQTTSEKALKVYTKRPKAKVPKS
ncbi:hypothetical protein GLYMA_06G321800v4 [Glycine max]|uniref:Uncharacterized protein n=2 Tax=Glycine max TaxID=3847 RepID=I1KFV7_SOYBN|nr:uncharacterized protein LOC100789572 isoform X1 [Glycine max]KAG5021170.1 hypothetical protein JHK87_017025 [Glycine soja]KAH1128562.1 hypothetical protein GYH30_016893 [Glycine max]KRH56397.1 hypothetical protein GLYMA_06G321800v4 [Glycine max]|eukprot:XP_003527573.1 uncharacterized protein LOC100789572 isoform X1 [Glycine max]